MTTENATQPTDRLAKARAAKAAKAKSHIGQMMERPAETVDQAIVDTTDAPAIDVGKLLETIASLQERIDSMEGNAPRFVPMKTEDDPRRQMANTYVPPQELWKRDVKSLTQDGQTVQRTVSPLENPAYLNNLPARFRPIFRSGDIVRVNPDKEIWGAEGRRWRDVLEKAKSDGVGEVVAVQHRTKTFEPKYSVFVKGLTPRSGEGFRESELLPV
jgi:hypothetical protein